MMQRLRSIGSRGTTFVELAVATAIIALLIVLIMDFLVNKIVENAIDNGRADLQLQTQLALDVSNRDVKHSANVDDQNRWSDNYAPGSPSDNFSWVSDGNTLILATPAQDQNGNILYEDPQAYVSYKDNLIFFVNSGVLYKRTLAAEVAGNQAQTTCPAGTPDCPADSKLADNVDSFAVSYFDANDNQVAPTQARSVQITLRVKKRVFTRELEVEQSLRSVFRNE